MDRTDIESAVLKVLSAILKLPFAAGTEVSRQSTPAWDSLKHIEIMFALEEELSVEFSENELSQLDSTAKIVNALANRHAP